MSDTVAGIEALIIQAVGDPQVSARMREAAGAAPDTVALYLEAHVTIEPVFDARREEAAAIAKRHKFRLADLLMHKEREATPERSDKDTFMTGHGKSKIDLFQRMVSLVRELRAADFQVWRYKVEDTLVDSRTEDVWGLLDVAPPEKPAFDLAAFGDRLRQAIGDRGIDQRVAAAQMRVNESTLSRAINGVQGPDLENYCRMLQWLEGSRG